MTDVSNIARGVAGFTSNVFLVTGERTVLVDAGANFDAVSRIESHVDRLDAVMLTHSHPDHVENLLDVAEAFDVAVWGFDTDVDGVNRSVDDESVHRFGSDDFVALHTPGHATDHLCFYAADPGILFAGDLVFHNGSFGRTDLPGGDREVLIESIDRLLDWIDSDLAVMHTGHGPSVTTDPYVHVERAGQFARQV